ncbi:patatin-like phospholipase family protein [Neisseriaceae bacterium B1]
MKSLPLMLSTFLAFNLTACQLVDFKPIPHIDRIEPDRGYRLEKSLNAENQDENFIILMLSGGGTRAAAFGYGVLEELNRRPLPLRAGKSETLPEQTDLVYGVSGGSVLATYFSLHGKNTFPSFENRFLKQNFQGQIVRQVLSVANMPRLASPQFGRGDLLQEQFENRLFHHKTFGDLARERKGPFAVISATDMAAGKRVDFTQEYFDVMCLNLSKLPIARAVAASSAVPIVFSPLTLNNHGGNCGYKLPERLQQALNDDSDESRLQQRTREEFVQHMQQYEDSKKRPYIHLLDGGLTDNLGLRNLLDMTEMYPANSLRNQMASEKTRRVIIIAVNAQNKTDSTIDQSASVPSFADQLVATINIPIDQYSQESLRRFRFVTDQINKRFENARKPVSVYFINLNLHDLPDSDLRHKALNIPTTFYLPREDVATLKKAAPILLDQSEEYQRLVKDLQQPEQAASAVVAPEAHEISGENNETQ